MTDDEYKPIAVSRRIGAPPSVIFSILADPARHRDLDGTGMLRGLVSGSAISDLGCVFVMQMYFDELGDYQMINHVVEYEPDRRIGWEPEADIDYGNIWIEGMAKTLEQLEALCARQGVRNTIS